jgi:hypothetical protein
MHCHRFGHPPMGSRSRFKTSLMRSLECGGFLLCSFNYGDSALKAPSQLDRGIDVGGESGRAIIRGHRTRIRFELAALKRVAPSGEIRLTGRSLGHRPALFTKIILFSIDSNHFHIAAVSSHLRGVSRSSRTRGGMRWTRMAPMTNGAYRGRRSRVVLTPRRRRQVGGKHFR